MKLLWVGLVVFACAVSGFLGLTAGINLNPESTVKYVPNWGSLGDWVAGISALLTFVVACVAMNAWRMQERQRLTLQWKADLVDYRNTLPYLKEVLTWPEDELHVQKAAGKFYECVKSYLLMIECVDQEKKGFYENLWVQFVEAHNAYVLNGAPRSHTAKVFEKVYNTPVL